MDGAVVVPLEPDVRAPLVVPSHDLARNLFPALKKYAAHASVFAGIQSTSSQREDVRTRLSLPDLLIAGLDFPEIFDKTDLYGDGYISRGEDKAALFRWYRDRKAAAAGD